MNTQNRRAKALLQAIDSIIEKHGSSNPDLVIDLLAHRVAIEQALQGRRYVDLVSCPADT